MTLRCGCKVNKVYGVVMETALNLRFFGLFDFLHERIG